MATFQIIETSIALTLAALETWIRSLIQQVSDLTLSTRVIPLVIPSTVNELIKGGELT